MIKARDLKMGLPFAEKESVPQAQEQRERNCSRGLPSVRKEGLRDKRVAIVGYGSSLVDTWPQLVQRGGQFDAIWTVSKAHDFLIERGLVPSYHTDTDYRLHKVAYNKRWQSSVRYLMATQVHPTYLDALAGRDVRLFHVLQPGGGTFDNRYYKSDVVFDAGLQAAQLAYELGYRTQEWFGMDACVQGGKTHAGAHEGLKHDPVEVEIAGKPWVMNPFLLRQAAWCEEMLHRRPKMAVTVLGAGALKPFLLERGRCKVF